MKKCFLCLPALAFLVGCASPTSPYSSMYNDYGFTYDYKEAPVPSPGAVPPLTNPAPVFFVQMPPPTVIYQQNAAVASTSVETNATAETTEANPYKGSYVIPPKVVVVPQETIIHENAGAAPGTNVVVQPTPSNQYPGYIYPGVIGGFTTTNTNATNGVTGGVTNTNPVISTNIGVTNVTILTNAPAGAARTNAPAPFTPVPGATSAPLPGVSTPVTRPQANTGGGTGPAGAGPQGPFSPAPTPPQSAPTTPK